MRYQSPIEVYQADPIMEDIKSEMDEIVVRAVQKVDVNVDKEELLKALAYDRGQYEKGYADGKRGSVKVVRCLNCRFGWAFFDASMPGGPYVLCGKPHAAPRETHKYDYYCADGIPKEDET